MALRSSLTVLICCVFLLSACDQTNPASPGPIQTQVQGTDLAWDISPDGASVLYQHMPTANQPAGVYLVHASGDSVPRLLFPPEVPGGEPTQLRFSPSGQKLVMVRGGHYDIFILDLNDGAETTVTFTYGNALSPDWDPSGRYIVYERPFLSYGQPDSFAGLFIVDTISGADGLKSRGV